MWTKPKTDWLPGDTLDVTVDMVRITGNLKYLAEVAVRWGQEINLPIKTEWAYTDNLTKAYMSSVILYLQALQSATGTKVAEVQAGNGPTAEMMNALEKGIQDVYDHMGSHKWLARFTHAQLSRFTNKELMGVI